MEGRDSILKGSPQRPCLGSSLGGRLPDRELTGTISFIYGSSCLLELLELASPAILTASWRSYSRDMTARSSICSYKMSAMYYN